MGNDNLIFLEVLEWFDETGQELVHRLPEKGSGEIKYGAQLTVRESQSAVFFYQGRAFDAFSPGRHTLSTLNIPVLTKVLSIPWGMTSPLRAEVYFVNMKLFPNLKWGTRDPVAFRDSELGLIRLRAHGVYSIQVLQPALLINRLVGTQGKFSTTEIEDYLSEAIVSRFNDLMGETIDTVFKLPGRYEELSGGLVKRLQEDFSHFGLGLQALYINSITPPAEVQKAIDDKSRLAVFDDVNKLLKMKAAMALEKIAETKTEAGAGIGMGLGLMMPAFYSETMKQSGQTDAMKCPDCQGPVAADATFCPACGHQLIVFSRCPKCGKNLTPHAKFCSRCGSAAGDTPVPKKCTQCSTDNLPDAEYCNHCGIKIG
jgi:membrane protease subunit (stomatin/prohibitin family)